MRELRHSHLPELTQTAAGGARIGTQDSCLNLRLYCLSAHKSWEGLVIQGDAEGLWVWVEGGLRLVKSESHLQGAVGEGIDAAQAWCPNHFQLCGKTGNQVEVMGLLGKHCGDEKKD